MNVSSHSVLKRQCEILEQLKEVSSGTDYEDEKGRILEVLENVEEARIQFEVCASLCSRFSSQTVRYIS